MQDWIQSAWSRVLAPLRAASTSDPPAPPPKRQLELYDLEERILFNAVPIGAEVLAAAAEPAPAEAPQVQDADATQSAESTEAVVQDSETLNHEVEIQRELVFVEGGAGNSDEQLQHILERDDSPRELTVVVLEGGRDQLEQISAALREHSGLNAVHFLSNGVDQNASDSEWFQESLAGRAAEISGWADALAPDAQLFIHNEGLTESSGRELAEALGALTHSDVVLNCSASPTESLNADSSDGASVVLIDRNLDDTETLTNAAADGAHIFFYDSLSESADKVLGDVVDWARATDLRIDSLVILSHGSAGAFGLGDQMIAASNLDLTAAAWRELAAVLTTEAIIGVYGCNVAEVTGDGQLLLDSLAELTGAEVFASSNLTGYSGDWNLEVGSFGAAPEIFVVSGAVLDVQALQSYSFNLASTAQGGETRANTTTSGTQETNTDVPPQAVAMDANGNYVVVWNGSGSGDTDGIFAQRYNSSGVAQGSEFRVNTTTTDVQGRANVAMDANGNFVITWTSDIGGANEGVRAQRYNASGVAQGSEIQVNTTTSGAQGSPVISMNTNGFVIAWGDSGADGSGYGVYAQRFDSTGTKLGSEFRVNSTTTGDQWIDSIAMNSSGNFIVTWSSAAQDGDGYGVYFKRYNSSGTALTGEVRANDTTSKDQHRSNVAINDQGAFVITWSDSDTDGAGNSGVMAKRYNSSGTAQGSEFQVNTTTAGEQSRSTVGIDQSGNFVVTWSSYNQDASSTWGIYRRDYYSDGTASSSETRVNTTTSGNQQYGGISMNGAGQYVVAWSGNGTGDTSGVFFQRYTETNQTPINTVSGAQWASGAAPLEFSTSNGNEISISDADGGTYDHQVTLTVSHGSLTLATTSGLSFVTGDGTGDATMTFTGSISSINTALNGLSYTVTPFYSGTDSLQIVTSDLANVGTGSALTDTDSITINVAAPSTPYVITGSYTGNGADSRNITGIGFQPDVVLIKARSADIGVMRTSSMSGDVSKDMTGATTMGANLIQSLLSDGFQIGTDASVNTNGVVYDYIVFKAADGYLTVGSYTGNGVDNRAITGLGMSPDALFIMDGANQEAVFSTTADEGNAYNFNNGNAGTNHIQSLDGDGFTLGNDNRVNQSGHTYYYIAWNEMAGVMDVGTYSGTGVDNRNVTGVGFQAEWVMVQSAGNDSVQHFDSQGATTDTSSFFDAAATTNRIQQLQSDGFQVGADADVNSSGVTYQYLAFKQQTAVTVSSISNQTINEDGTTGAIAFTIGDSETSASNLSVRVTSSNSTLVPSGNLTLGGSGANRTLTITPAANQNGTSTITVEVTDGATIATRTFTLTVNAVNDVPVRTAGSPAAINVNEDSANTTAVSLGMSGLTYGVGGGSDESAQTLTYRITAIPSHMTLWLADGTTQVSANTTLSLAQLQGLQYKTVANAVGSGNLTWTVQDSGGTANGGADTLTETLSITVGAVNDQPVRTAGSPTTITVGQDSANTTAISLGMNSLTYGVGGGGDESAQTLTYRITAIPSHMTLWLADGTTQVAANTTLSLAQLQGLKYKTVAGAVGNGSLTWTVQDSGGTANGGADTLTETLAVNVFSVTSLTGSYVQNFDSLGTGGTAAPAGYSVFTIAGGTSTYNASTPISAAGIAGATIGSNTLVVQNTPSTPWAAGNQMGNVAGVGDANDRALGTGPTGTAASIIQLAINNNTGGSLSSIMIGYDMETLNSGSSGSGETGELPGYSFFYSTTGGSNASDWTYVSSLSISTAVSGAVTHAEATITFGSAIANGQTIYFRWADDNSASNSPDQNIAIDNVVINHAPTLGAGTLASVLEETTNSAGQTVSTIFSGQFADADAGAGFSGIAVVGNTADPGTQGTWQYSSNGGTNWFAIGTVTDSGAGLAISSTSLVRFVPVANYAGTPPALVVRGLDNTYSGGFSTTAGSESRVSIDTTANGGTRAISAATAGLSTTITPVNDAPVRTAGSPTAINVNEDSANTTAVSLGMSGLTYGVGGGSDESAQTLTYTVTAIPSFVTLWLADGTTQVASGTSVSLAQLQGLKYKTVADANGTGNLTWTVQDNGGTANGGADLLTENLSITVNAVNDAPLITSNGGGTTANVSVNENTAAVTTVTGTDIDGGTAVYSISGGADSTRFSINSSTGALTFATSPNAESPLDSDTNNIYIVIVQISDGAGGLDTQTITVTVNDLDEFDVGSVSDANAGADSVAENAANGTVVGVTASALDADATTNAITYSLSDSAGGRFAINASTGVVTVADGTLLNREAVASHNITVVATSADGSTSNATFTINLTDVDEFDVGAVSDANAAANSVAENATNGTVVGITATATDADATTNGITYSLTDDAGGRFAINASTGVVTVANSSLLNREAAASHNITVLATSADGSTSNVTFTINLTDVDEFDVGAVSDLNAAANSIAENAANGTVVGITASASDTDATTNTVTYSLSDSAGGRFAINASTGVVTVADGTLLDREAAASHNITVVATSADGSTSNATFTISLTDVDEFDVGAVTDANVAANSVAENAANGTVVGITASASDADATTNAITYSLTDDAGGRFAINASTGVVTVADGSLLNREAAASHNVTVRATSADGSISDATFTINLTDVDEFDVGSVSDSNAAANSVAENAANGTVVGITASASDVDATTNGITYSLTDDAGGRFAIDAATGVVTVADGSLLNREAAASHNVTVRATSADGSISDATFTINLADVDEFDVGSVTDVNAAANTVAENAANGSIVGLTASASDADATTNAVSYSLIDDAGGRFAINATTGVVTVADGSLLDREAAASHNVTVRAASADGSISDATFTISLTDVDEFDVGAVSDTNGTVNSVAENAADGTTVGITASASDADTTANAITYSLTDDAGGRFAIDAVTGVVTVADSSLLNRESAASYNVTVRATSADGSTSEATFAISLTDVDEFDVGTASDADAAANVVTENAVAGTAVGITASASDADATTNAITYSLTDDAGGRFAINATTGVVTVADGSLLDREAAASHNVTIRATSADGSTSDTTLTINLADADEFDVGTITDANGAANTVAENAAAGTVVGVTASASDADATTNGISYSLIDDAGGRFAINATTGVVTVADGTLLDREAAASHNVTVRATSADGSTSDATFTISLTDVDEFDVGAVSDTNAGANSVAENAAAGTTVGITASASDVDATTNAVTYSLIDDAGGRFAINATTGVVTVADGSLLDREAAAAHNVTVRATSADGSTSDVTFTISLTDVDEFDVGTVTDTNAAADSVAENAANGTVVGVTATASDLDATTNAITYSLTDDAGGRFVIDSVTGVVTVADGSLLNREAAASHNITILAASADGSASSATFTIQLTDVDEFDIGAVSDANAAANSVAENAANGTVVGITATASDADTTTNAITYSLTDDAGGRFAIDAVTGVVTVADGTLLNRESAAVYNITVLAASADGSTSNATFTINLNDVDEFDVGAVSDANAAANNVAENAANGTIVGITASASDADATTNAITYSLTDDAGGRFVINAATGVMTVADGSLLDWEAAASHNVTVRATSADGSTSDTTFTIHLTDVDEFDVGAVTDANAAVNAVAENAANGTAVGITAFATDADATTNAVTYSLTDDAGGRFAINTTTGVVTVADGTLLDRESAASYNITILAASADGSTSSATFSIDLTDTDEFDVGAVTDTNAAANTVAENAANGTTVGITASASDADATTHAITYSLTDDAGGRFAINAATGVVTVANGSLLDREAAASHNITVRATSADGSTADSTFTINLTDADEFDVGSAVDIDVAANSVAENAANGTTVGVTASAADADATTNSVSYSLLDDAGGRFAIHSSTGVVTVADGSLLNREAAASYNVTIRALSADGSTSDTTFTIHLTDVDEFDVGAVSDANVASNTVAENAANGAVVGVTAFASDSDATTNTVSYSLTDDAGGRFAINAATGVVTVADGSLLDRESAASHNIVVRATSADGSTSDATFTINVTDVDEFDVGPVSDINATTNSVAENAANGTTVGITASAADADVTNNAVTYALTDDAGGRFTINAATGVVTVADGSLLNREAAASHSIIVRATSADGSTSDVTFTINLTDVDEFDVGVISDTNAAANSVAEDAANGTVVGITATATDADATTNAITYALTDDAGGRFAIHATTGVVTVADGSLLDRQLDSSYDITVQATSADGSLSSATFTILLTDVDNFDVGPVSDADASANTVAENAANGTIVGLTATATDADATTNEVTYALIDNAGGRFAIDSATGVVTVANGSLLDREAAAAHNVTVRATSADGSTSDATFTINLTDVDEFDVGIVTDTNAAANSVAENAANGTTVGLAATAGDLDATTNAITYSLTDDAGGRFAINATTGVVTVADGSLLDRETAASHAVTVRATSADGSTSDAIFTINLTDVDELDVGPVSDVNAAANSIAENAADGTVVGITASASDADATTNVITYTLTDNAGGRFAINASTGVVTVADGTLLDRESAASHNVTIRATSADGSTSDATFTINLTDVDEFDVGAVSDANAAANSVAENAANGSVVGITAFASDADATTNGVTYSLTDNAGGRFAINASTGVVTVADGTLLDRESAAAHNVTVRATSADGSMSDATLTINLTDADEFDVGSVSDADVAADLVAENAANGTAVGITAAAADADATTSAISYSLVDDAGGRFAINAATGVVTVADGTLLNREAAASHNVTVRATSADGSASDATFTINLTDVDEFDVGSVTDANVAANSVAENATNGTVVGITASASDADATTNGITYSLTDDAGGRFAINASTGVVTVANSSLLNREAAASHNITVLATSADGSTSNVTFTINLTDVDEFDVGAVSDLNAAANSIAENAANGTVVGITASASDTDATTNTVTYSLSDSAGGRFAINAATGVVTVADGTLLDREAAASHNITVVATSADGSTSNATFTINLSDVDEFDVGSVSDANVATNSVAENAANGTVVGITATATDADATTNAITYSLTDDAGGRFAIDASTGVVTVADGTLLNRESAASHNVTVRATSADGSISDATFTINLTDVDEFDVGAVSDANAAANSVAENAANGTVVGITASASDADATTNAITYSLTDDAGGRFAIDASTGVVTVADGSLLNREAAASHNVTVRATSADGSISDATFTINLADVDEFDVGPVTDVNAAANSVAENAANGTVVGLTAGASDADATTNAVSYSLIDDAGGRFAINATTGVVTVADGSLLDREAAASHNVTVRATSADGSTSDATFTINLTDADEFDVGAVSDTNAAANSVAENAANGTVVGITASASDADTTANAITYSLTDDAGGRFAIDAVTGVVTVADSSLLNRESAASYNVIVRATSADGSTSEATFAISLADVDEFDVGTASDADAAANVVAENAANGTAVGITASASDADATTNAITYSLTDDAGGRFAINATTGVVTVADGSLLDREAAASHNVTIRATSADGSTSDTTLTINLADADEFDVGTITDANAAANTVAENAANGTVVGVTASASDADATTNGISYSLIDDAGGRFSINATTGVVTVADGTLLDREAAASHNVTVRATSADGSTSDATFTISLTDADEFDVGAVSDANAAANSVAENAANGTTVGITASASDADATTNAVTFSLIDDAGGRFAINATTGVVIVADGSLLDREAAAAHNVTVRATSADGSTSDATFTITLTDVDEFDVGTVTDTNAAADSVAENAANGTVVGVTATASDTDATTNAITYSLTDDAGGRFAIDAVTGVVTVADGSLLDHEAAASHVVTVRATSADGSFGEESLMITVVETEAVVNFIPGLVFIDEVSATEEDTNRETDLPPLEAAPGSPLVQETERLTAEVSSGTPELAPPVVIVGVQEHRESVTLTFTAQAPLSTGTAVSRRLILPSRHVAVEETARHLVRSVPVGPAPQQVAPQADSVIAADSQAPELDDSDLGWSTSLVGVGAVSGLLGYQMLAAQLLRKRR